MTRTPPSLKLSVTRARSNAIGALAVVSLVGLLGGCTSTTAQLTAASNGEPVEGGTVRIGTTADLTPSIVFSGTKPSESTLTGLVYDRLISYPEDSLEPQSELAQSWEVSEDGLTVTLDLREDVKYHDGSPFTSEDVRFSLSTYADSAYGGQLARIAALIAEFDTSDPYRVTLHLTEPVNNIFDLLTIVPMIHEESFEQWQTGEAYIGTGAFEFTGWFPGSRVEFEANETYWDGAPKVDGAELLIIPDQQTQFSQLRSGQLDILAAALPRDIQAVADNPTFKVVEFAGTNPNVYIGSNVTAPGLEDPRIRQAINLAVDRDRIVEEVYQGRARSTSLPWPKYSPGYDPAADRPRQDLAAAKKLANEVSAERGEFPSIPLNFNANNVEHQNIAEILAGNLAELGIETTLLPTEYTTMVSQLRAGSFEGLWILSHGFSQFNPSTLVSSAFPFNSGKNSSNFQDPGYTAAVQKAWKTIDPNSPEALAGYGEVNEALLDNSFVIELVAPAPEIITTGNLHGIGWSKRAEYDLSDAYFTE